MAHVGIETQVDDDKVRCELCLKHNFMNYRGDWITLKMYKTKHQKTSIHLASIMQQLQETEVENQRLQGTPGYFATPKNIDIGVGLGPSSLPSYNRNLAQDQMQEMWDTFDGTFELEDSAAEL